jgi:glutamate synthase domain-containing protein 1
MLPDRDSAYPLYDPRYEHDACGVGFVADAGGRHRARVLALALAGLGALGHRGAFAADGASSDGAGILLPLERSLWRVIDPTGHGRRAVVALFLPADAATAEAARRRTEAVLARAGLPVVAWRRVPVDPSALGPEARATLPLMVHAVVRCSASNATTERRLLLARRELEIVADHEGWRGYAVVSASTRTVVYKGLVAGGRLAALFSDLADPTIAVSHAVFHQRYATNTSPTWSLAQPFRRIAHNGEINTVRANREALRGRAAALGGAFGRRMASLGPLLDPRGSDSQSLDETLDLLVASGWSLPAAMLLAMPEAPGLRDEPIDELASFQQRMAGVMAPWDGPAAMAFSDGRQVGAILDRNGLRPLAVTVTHDRLVAAASEAGAVPIAAAETAERRRLGPGELFLVDPAAGLVLHDADAKRHVLRDEARHEGRARHSLQRIPFNDRPPEPAATGSGVDVRWIAGLDAERFRLDIRTMALEGHEPLWSMGDDTPLPGLSRMDRRAVDHLRQSFAQVTNPPIDPERERVVMDLAVELGRRAPLLRVLSAAVPTVRLTTPVVADLDGLVATLRGPGPVAARAVRTLDATWDAADGGTALDATLDRLAAEAVSAARRGTDVLIVSDRRIRDGRMPAPSVLAVGAVHTALTDVGLRGSTDIVADASDLLDIHATAMVLAAGARAVVPWLAVELAAEQAGGRGAEDVSPAMAIGNLVGALGAGLRKVLARMGISTMESYVGGQLFEVLELERALVRRCFPAAPSWPGTIGVAAIAARQLARTGSVPAPGREPGKFPDPGRARFRGDGEQHLYAPTMVKALQALVETGVDGLPAYRAALERAPATVRDQLEIRPATPPVAIETVEAPERIVRRFVGAAMSLGALSPEAHQAITIGLRRVGAAANSGEGGEDPDWYLDDGTGSRRDSTIKQIASGRFGVTAQYLARAEQLEIKMAQGSKPGEGGQLPARKVTEHIARLRRGRVGRSMISPPPHHDIYSIEDLAQLIADLRSIDPGARIGVKLVAAWASARSRPASPRRARTTSR